MRNAIREYLGLSDEEKKELIQNAIIVFDTNVLLDLYRLNKESRELVFKVMDKCKERLWIPYQVAYEFIKNRPVLIGQTVKKYEEMTQKVIDFTSILSSLSINKKDVSAEKIRDDLEKIIEKYKSHNLEVVQSNSDQVILPRVLDFFEKKVGRRPDEKMKNEIIKEGEERYKSKIPPGYMDKSKGIDQNAFGDLLVWKEIIEYAKEQGKDVVFVTRDQKEDWWWIVEGKTLGPRPEIVREFYDETTKRIYLYSTDQFIRYIEGEESPLDKGEDQGLEEKANILQYMLPIESASESLDQENEDDQEEFDSGEFDGYDNYEEWDKFGEEAFKHDYRIWANKRIQWLSSKNQRRQEQIDRLQMKLVSNRATDEDKKVLLSTIKTLAEGKKEIERLREEILNSF